MTEEKAPLVSVWMITYNHEPFIRQSIESVIMQKADFAFEIVIGEDCSTDGTREIVKELERKYPEIIRPIYHEKNVGAIRNAYEFCLPQLKGKYVACLEGDDYWTDPNKLAKQVQFMEDNLDCSYCFHDVKIVENNQETDKYKTKSGGKYKKDKPHTSALFFRNVIEIPDEFYKTSGGDFFLYYLLNKKGKGGYVKDVLPNYYRIHSGGVISTASKEVRLAKALSTRKAIYSYTKRAGSKKEILKNNRILIRISLSLIKHKFKLEHVRFLYQLLKDRLRLIA